MILLILFSYEINLFNSLDVYSSNLTAMITAAAIKPEVT